MAVLKVWTQPLIAEPTESIFPDAIALSSWKLKDTSVEEPAPVDVTYDQLLQGQSYQFAQANRKLKVQLGYFFNTNGDVVVLQKRLASLSPSPEETEEKMKWTPHQDPSFGAYLTGRTAEGEDVLLTCINPKGNNTTNGKQFSANRVKFDLNPMQAFRWFIGGSQLLDKRCLWGRMSLSQQSSQDDSSKILKKLWLEVQPQISDIL